MSSNTECQSTDIELNYTYASVDKLGTVTGQHEAKGATLSTYSCEDTGTYSDPNESNINESAQMSYTYASVDKHSKKTDKLPKKSQLADEDEGKHYNNPQAQEEAIVTDDYTYAEVNQKSKPSLDTEKTYDHPKKLLLADEDEEKHNKDPEAQEEATVPDDYTYAEVTKKSKPSWDADRSTETTTSQAVNTQDDEFSYLYSSVDKKRAQND